jgi:cold shock CspA family protein
LKGTVAEFDEHVGVGTIRGEDSRDYFFHCTRIADDSRTIDVGASVRFEVVAGHLGQWEASDVEKL